MQRAFFFRCVSALATLTLAMIDAGAARAEVRVALVIGNSDYHCDRTRDPNCRNARRLPNAAGDAASMMTALRGQGFDVVHGFNLTRNDTHRRIDEFSQKAATADVVVVYYAGHGIQWRGRNYLVATDALLPTTHVSERDNVSREVATNSLDFEENVLKRARTHKKGGINIVFLDACRNDPWDTEASAPVHGFPSGPPDRAVRPNRLKSEIGALGRMELPETYLAYATLPGEVADDGKGSNSPFTTALLAHLSGPSENIHEMMAKVTGDVVRVTDGKQRPTAIYSLTRSFSFGQRGASQSAPISNQSIPTKEPSAAAASLSPSMAGGLPLIMDRCERQFAEARSSTSPIDALGSFLGDCNGHSRVTEAAEMRNQLLAVRADTQACERAMRTDTIEALRAYEVMFRNGQCKARIEQRIAALSAPPRQETTIPRAMDAAPPQPLPRTVPPPQPNSGFRCETGFAIGWLERHGAYGDGPLDPSVYASSVRWTVRNLDKPPTNEMKPQSKIIEEDATFKAAYPVRRYSVRSSNAIPRGASCTVELVLDFSRRHRNGKSEAGTVKVVFDVEMTYSAPRIVGLHIDVLARR